MYACLTEFRLPPGTDWESIRQLAQQRAQSHYGAVPGLVAKAFVVAPEEGIYGGHYVWESREACETFLASELFQGAVAKFGQPKVKKMEVAAYLERGRLTST